MNQFDAALAAVGRRYEHFMANGDPDAVLGPAAKEDIVRLYEASVRDTPQGQEIAVPGLQGVALLYWCRCVAAARLGHAPDPADEQAAVHLFQTLEQIDPALVPADVRATLAPPYQRLFAEARQWLTAATASVPFDADGVRRAIELFEQAVAAAEGTPDHAEALGGFGASMIDLYQVSGDERDLARAITALRAAIPAMPAQHPMHPLLRASLGGALVRRFGHSADLSDVDEAAAVLRAVLDVLPDERARMAALADLASALEGRARWTGAVDDIATAIDATRAALPAMTSAHPSHGPFSLMLGRLHALHYDQAGEPSDVDEWVDAMRTGLTPDDIAARRHTEPRMLVDDLLGLGVALMVRSGDGRTREADMGGCVAAARTAVDVLPDNPKPLVALAVALRQRGTDADLREAVETHTRVLELGGAEFAAEWGVTMTRYAQHRLDRFAAGAERSDVDAAVDAFAAAIERLPNGSQDWLVAVRGHAVARSSRHEHFGDTVDADAAIDGFRAMLPALDGDDAERGRVLWRLGAAYQQRHARTGEFADVNNAVEVVRDALGALAYDDPERRDAIVVLGSALSARARQRGGLTDRVEAARSFSSALTGIADDDPDRSTAQIGLAHALTDLAEAARDTSVLDEAITAYHNALTLDLRQDESRRVRGGLGNALALRARLAERPSDLDEAVELLRSSLDDGTRPEHYAGSRVNLAEALKWRYLASSRPEDLDEAARLLTEAVPHASRGTWPLVTSQLAEVRRLRNAPGDAEPALRDYRAVADDQGAPTWLRVYSARAAGRIAVERAWWPEAVAAYTIAVELLPLIAWRGLERADQQRYLADYAGLAGEAAAAALSAGRPRTAVELFEHGRAVLWTQVLQTRGDPTYGSLDQLAAQDPELASELADVRAASVAGSASPDAGLPAEMARAHARTVLAHREQELVARVRALPGYADFLRRKGFDELRAAADAGPVVLVNVNSSRCDALVVTAGEVRVVPLDITAAELSERAAHLLEPRPRGRLGDFVRAQESLVGTLGWLWDKVVGPVLRELPGERRVWWCPSGLLALFPLHVAGDYAGPVPESAMDRVVSSYTSTMAALIRARNRPETHGGRLVVGVAAGPDGPALPHVADEVARVAAASGEPCTLLVDEAATADRVLAELGRHPLAHIACHGRQDTADPSRSSLAMHDRQLTVLEIAGLDLARAELAFLSACETSASAAIQDEAISPAAALHLAGYRHVIATLWPIPDRSGPAESVYRTLDRLDRPGPAEALHHAVRELMAAHPYEPSLWAPYQHVGP